MLDLIRRIQDSPKDQTLLAELLDRNTGLLRKLAACFLPVCALRGDVGLDDLLQEGSLALIAAAMTFQPDTGKSWPGWAAWYAKTAIRRALGAKHQLNEYGLQQDALPPLSVYLDEPLPGAEESGGEATRLDLLTDNSLPDPDGALMLEDLRKAVRDAVDALPELQSYVIRRRRLEGRTAREIATERGQTCGALHNAERAGFKLLRRTLKKTAREYDLDRRTRFYRYKGVDSFQRTQSSTTEDAALWRISQQEAREEPQNRP